MPLADHAGRILTDEEHARARAGLLDALLRDDDDGHALRDVAAGVLRDYGYTVTAPPEQLGRALERMAARGRVRQLPGLPAELAATPPPGQGLEPARPARDDDPPHPA